MDSCIPNLFLSWIFVLLEYLLKLLCQKSNPGGKLWALECQKMPLFCSHTWMVIWPVIDKFAWYVSIFFGCLLPLSLPHSLSESYKSSRTLIRRPVFSSRSRYYLPSGENGISNKSFHPRSNFSAHGVSPKLKHEPIFWITHIPLINSGVDWSIMLLPNSAAWVLG